MPVLNAVILILGMATAMVGSIWLIVVAFQESSVWGMGCLFFAPVGLVFVVLHWDDAHKPFFVQLAGIAILIIGEVALNGQLVG